MIRQINRVTAVIIFLLLSLIVNVSYIQVFQAHDLRKQAGNQRVILTEYSRERGPILLGSKAVAQSTPTSDSLKYLREYAAGPTYAAISGFYSLVYGATGIEREENDVLAGNDSRFFVDRMQQLLAGRKPKGGAIRLTIDPDAQAAAVKALNGRTGAVVAIDPKTGAILALASSPSFDPNLLSSHNAADIQKNYESLNTDPNQPLLNRPLAMTLPPGSTFKLVTAAAALESGKYTAASVLPGPAELALPGTDKKLGNWTGKSCGANGKVSLKEALAISCNTAFASLGLELGASAIYDQAKKFGFESSFDVPMTAATSHFPVDPNESQTAMSAIGQFDVRATALQMAMVSAGIANEGIVMRPYLVSQILGPDLSVLQNTTPLAFGRAMSSENANVLRDMMVNVVSAGTGTNARISGIVVGGKTGTAENTPGESAHAWFVGFAPAEGASIAIAVVLEHGGGATEVSGNALAAPIAAAVMKALLKQ
jgi:peptidoglycan glycosyltransferase